jgi:hypothetical protein
MEVSTTVVKPHIPEKISAFAKAVSFRIVTILLGGGMLASRNPQGNGSIANVCFHALKIEASCDK